MSSGLGSGQETGGQGHALAGSSEENDKLLLMKEKESSESQSSDAAVSAGVEPQPGATISGTEDELQVVGKAKYVPGLATVLEEEECDADDSEGTHSASGKWNTACIGNGDGIGKAD